MSQHRGLVLASHPRFCPVCRGDRDVEEAPPRAPELAARVRCPHCGPLRLPLMLSGINPPIFVRSLQ